MGGSVKLEKSKKDKFTVFSFSFNVKQEPSSNNKANQPVTKPINFKDSHPEMQEYLDSIGVDSAVSVVFESK